VLKGRGKREEGRGKREEVWWRPDRASAEGRGKREEGKRIR